MSVIWFAAALDQDTDGKGCDVSVTAVGSLKLLQADGRRTGLD